MFCRVVITHCWVKYNHITQLLSLFIFDPTTVSNNPTFFNVYVSFGVVRYPFCRISQKNVNNRFHLGLPVGINCLVGSITSFWHSSILSHNSLQQNPTDSVPHYCLAVDQEETLVLCKYFYLINNLHVSTTTGLLVFPSTHVKSVHFLTSCGEGDWKLTLSMCVCLY